MSRRTGSNAFGPIPRARIAPIFDSSRLPKLKFLDRLAAELKAAQLKRAELLATGTELSALVAHLKSRAEAEQWSQRELAQRLGLSWGTWQRICHSAIDPIEWLPKVRAAAGRLDVNRQPEEASA
jgi:hypothetical protein